MPRSDADQQLFNAFQDTSKFGISIAELGKDERYKGYFMTIIADHECGISKELSKDATVERALSADLLDPQNHSPQRPARTQHRAFVPRKHHRVVFKEFCSTVGDLETMGEVASVLEQTTIALRLMLCAGWVHRDISSGNILAFRPTDTERRQAKLSDLKYARKYPPDPTYQAAIDPKTSPRQTISSNPPFSQKHTAEQPAAPARSSKKRTREGTTVGAQVDGCVLASVPEDPAHKKLSLRPAKEMQPPSKLSTTRSSTKTKSSSKRKGKTRARA
ncbi:hypothetical protein ONZ45_g12899 [Pleurotus djamor]|nr:hypothetical protein ONZ45_g12899 [Pleurotus djamor]